LESPQVATAADCLPAASIQLLASIGLLRSEICFARIYGHVIKPDFTNNATSRDDWIVVNWLSCYWVDRIKKCRLFEHG
jgi:hypothetical protein